MSDVLTSDDSLLTDDSSVGNRTIDLEEATFPSRTPVIDTKAAKLGRLSLGATSEETSIRNSNLRNSKQTPPLASRQHIKRQSMVTLATPKGTIARPSVAKLDFESKETDSAFQRRKAYDEARRKSLLPSASQRIDPRRKSNVFALSSVARQRKEITSARIAKRTESRRALVNRNRAGLNE
ncbi:unnamed protein product [Hymenolepis diminuta]|uniref:TPX2 domain-containing protein n=1 Tax=Hymenolepis diminuta TaxID=6216 RepID=A0A0R3SWA3_HYMDI|nr:unnamed protein product [Hymenolepis diminuta]